VRRGKARKRVQQTGMGLQDQAISHLQKWAFIG
jgi:hypothetical protein